MRTASVNQSLESTISRARLRKYLGETGGDLDAAIGLYERNTRLSEASYTTLQGLEICLRNTIDHQMQARYGESWLTNGEPPLSPAAIDTINGTIAKLKSPSRDDVVAELKFSFWVGLLAKRHDKDLWRQTLYRGFLATTGIKRGKVYGRMNALRRFRNRVAHHEPVFHNALQMHTEALEAIGWMSADTHTWISACSRFNEVYKS